MRRSILFVVLAAALAGVVFTGVAAGRSVRTLDSVFDGTWQSTRGEMIIRAANDFIDFGEYGDNMIGRLCGVHVTPDNNLLGTELSGWWYEGGPTFTILPDGTDCGPLKGTPYGRFFFDPSSDGKTLTGKFETKGDGLPIGNTSKWPAWNATKAGSSSGGSSSGKTVTKLATASNPFGTPVIGYVPVGPVIDIPSPKLPPLTTEVDASAQLSNAEIDKMLAGLKLPVIGGKRPTIESLSSYCLFFIPVGSSSQIGSDYAAVPNQCDRLAATLLQSGGKYRYLSALKAGCTATFVPFWKPGSRVSVAQHNAAVAAEKSKVQASCTGTRTGRLSFKIVARGQTTLNQALGKSVPAAVGSAGPAGTAQLKVTWAQPRTRTTTPGTAGKAQPGHYAGQTNAPGTISFDVTADSTGVTNLKVTAVVDCTDTTSWNWTITSAATNAITASRTFSRSYNGGLKISSSTISNIKISYTLSGTLTATGSASGKFQVLSMSWDDSSSGKSYTCTGALTSWTARIGG